MPSYDIKTYVNYVNNDAAALGVSTTVLILVDSRSNLAPAMRPVTIDTLTQFKYYFSDPEDKLSKSLLTARRLLNAGYSLMALNVRECEHRLALRVTKDKKSSYYDADQELAALPNSSIDKSDLAIRIDLDSLTNNSYVLLQQTVKPEPGSETIFVPYICNTLIYTTGSAPLYGAMYTRSIHVDRSEFKTKKQLSAYLKNMLMYNNSYFVAEAEDYSYIQIASRYKFDSIGIRRDVDVEYDPGFEQAFLSRAIKKDRLLDMYSKYTSDIADLQVDFSRDTQGYTAQISKYSQESIHTAEVFSAATAEELVAVINDKSLFIHLDLYDSYLPIGSFKLETSGKPEAEITDTDFERAIDVMYEWKQNSSGSFFTDLSVNIIYEPDVYSIRSQALINNIFDSKDCPIIKMLNYLGLGDEESNPMSSYFDCCEYTMYDGSVRTSKEIYLEGLMSFSLGQLHSDITGKTVLRRQECPSFVNQITLAPTGYAVGRPICFFNGKRFDLLDLLPISLINKVVRANGYTAEFEMLSAKNQVNSYMGQMLGYSANLDLMYYISYDGIVSVGFSYETSVKEEIDTIELVLDARK